MSRDPISGDQIKAMLVDRIDAVVARYAPPAPGSHTTRGKYFTMNPGRADRSVGSFVIRMDGPSAGRWNDYATGQRGDLVDLIGLCLGLSVKDAFAEARAFLGLTNLSPEDRARQAEAAAQAAAQAAARRRQQEAQRAADRARHRKWAEGLWMSAQERIAGTPVEAYLRARGIDLAALGRQPRALRYHPACTLVQEMVDGETGEVREVRSQVPAMVAGIVNGRGEIIGAHRTYLRRSDGIWRKEDGPAAKKVLGEVKGGCIRLSSGTGARGGKAPGLNSAPPGSEVVIAEGIETALSALILRPGIRVVAAVSLGNMAEVELPGTIARVVLVSDGDSHPQAAAAFDRAVAAHAAKGRTVRVWRSPVAGEDLNDALRRALREGQEGAA
jgi:hypothetical protein